MLLSCEVGLTGGADSNNLEGGLERERGKGERNVEKNDGAGAVRGVSRKGEKGVGNLEESRKGCETSESPGCGKGQAESEEGAALRSSHNNHDNSIVGSTGTVITRVRRERRANMRRRPGRGIRRRENDNGEG